MLKGAERRKFYRHPIHVPLKIEVTGHDEMRSESEDLSLGGLSFFSPSHLSKGDTVRVYIPVKEKMFEVNGKTAYSVGDKKSGKYRSGILFTDMPSAFKAKLAEEALEIMEYRRVLSKETGKEVSEEEAAQKWIQQFANRFSA